MSTISTLETARLRLRPYRESDIEELLPLIGTREVAATTLRIPHPYTVQDAKAFLLLVQEPGRIWLAISLRSDGRQIGGIGLTVDQQHQHAELGYWLGAPYWGKGYATEAVRAVVAWGDAHFASGRTACIIAPENVASIRVAGKCGYHESGRTSYKGNPTIVFIREPE